MPTSYAELIELVNSPKPANNPKGIWVLPEIIAAFGGLSRPAIILSQLMFRSNVAADEHGWFPYTQEALYSDTGIGPAAQLTACRLLIGFGVIETKLVGIPRRKFYRINKDAVERATAGERMQFQNPISHKRRAGSRGGCDPKIYNAWREAVLERDGHECQRCHKSGGLLEAHHIKEWAQFPELRFDVSNGETLHASCHAQEHRERRARAAAAETPVSQRRRSKPPSDGEATNKHDSNMNQTNTHGALALAVVAKEEPMTNPRRDIPEEPERRRSNVVKFPPRVENAQSQAPRESVAASPPRGNPKPPRASERARLIAWAESIPLAVVMANECRLIIDLAETRDLRDMKVFLLWLLENHSAKYTTDELGNGIKRFVLWYSSVYWKGRRPKPRHFRELWDQYREWRAQQGGPR